MKELTTEEKAKAYDEALSVARKTHQTQPMYRDWLEKMFPELAESEDERISKAIISAIKEDWPGHADWIAWIEKQVEHKPWSEEDEENLNWFEKFFRAESVIAEGKDIPQDRYLWFKNLKNRVQPKQELSEEDEKYNNIVVSALYNPSIEGLYNFHKINRSDVITWLKSLKERVQPQSQWKPSDEHYELEEFAKIVRCNLTGISKTVQELFEAKYQQLTGNKMYRGFKD